MIDNVCGLMAARHWWIIRWEQYFSRCWHVLVLMGRQQTMSLSVAFRF